MMSGGRSNHTENLVLIAATAFLVIAVQHYFQADTPPSSATSKRRAGSLATAQQICA
jgi:hypothetical protein